MPDKIRTKNLSLGDIFEKLRLTKTSMVVLSACETGIIKSDLSDEYMGLPSGFLYAGSPSVIGSLWTVNDRATALLMYRFYKNIFEGLSIAGALSEAQKWIRDLTPNKLIHELDEEEAKPFLEKNEVNFSHPYYWAGFFAIGDSYHIDNADSLYMS